MNDDRDYLDTLKLLDEEFPKTTASPFVFFIENNIPYFSRIESGKIKIKDN